MLEKLPTGILLIPEAVDQRQDFVMRIIALHKIINEPLFNLGILREYPQCLVSRFAQHFGRLIVKAGQR